MTFDPLMLFHLGAALVCFVLGAVVGSFVNVCIYRLPWQKSILWPGSHCPRCLRPIAARDNLPIVGWIALGGKCRGCGLSISPRYPLIEALVGALFALAYSSFVVYGGYRLLEPAAFLRAGYHAILIVLLVIATFIDYDYYLIPDSVTVTGMVLGLGLGTLFPGVRPEPVGAATALEGLTQGLLGWAVGGGVVWVVRWLGGLVFRREAMGFGDVTLLAMIGSFLGWQAALLTFFLAPFFGLAHVLVRLCRLAAQRLLRRPPTGADREIPFGPYLSLAALTLMLGWPWIWPGWAKRLFQMLGEISGIFS
ncbi:MAG: type 4 prepilin-like proteins leader peptide-processing enzyme [Isosphaeraceae bacterium]|jgi:leader peptidase (prepilin peptidase)/N-methyltransferase|nr:MAG: type 4 prepilin-like proteins leader peptide-processing enzyme [Isosphaeraceae bacterium]